MNPFKDILVEINNKLDLPQPEKSRILLEISSDLHDSLAYFESRGLSREAAVERALERFSVSEDSLEQLTRIHESLVRRVMDRLSRQVQSRWERVIFVVLLLFILLYTGDLLLTDTFFIRSSRFVWPVAGIALVILLVTIWKSYLLFIKRDHRVRTLRTGLPLLFFLSVGSLVMGFYGLIVETYSAMNRILGDLPGATVSMYRYLLGVSSLMVVSLMVAILGGLIWFVLIRAVFRIERAEAAVLLES